MSMKMPLSLPGAIMIAALPLYAGADSDQLHQGDGAWPGVTPAAALSQAASRLLPMSTSARADTRLPEAWQRLAEQRAHAAGLAVAPVIERLESRYRQRLVTAPAPAGAALTVGNDPDCDFSATAANNGLQEAIGAAWQNGASLTEIRVTRTGDYDGFTYNINNGPEDQIVTLAGGFDNCADTTPSGNTVLDGGGGIDSVIEIFASTAGDVTLRNLELRNGGNDPDFGGGLEIEGPNSVIGDSLVVASNVSEQGGGIYMAGTNVVDETTLLLAAGSRIESNSADFDGGGIHCRDQGSILLASTVSVSNNNAGQDGGGVYLDNCSMRTYASFPGGIFFNTAERDGGGAALFNGALLEIVGGNSPFGGLGNAAAVTTIDGNSAARHGGGLLLRGLDTEAVMVDADLSENQADADGDGFGSGGGAYLRDQASFIARRVSAPEQCARGLRCSTISSNAAGSGGGALAAWENSELDIAMTWLEFNTSASGPTAVLFNNNGGDPAARPELTIEGSVFAENPTDGTDTNAVQGVVDVQSNALVTVAHTTFADNLDSALGRNIVVFDNVDLKIFSNIFAENAGQVFFATWDADTEGIMNCALAHEAGSLPPGFSNVLQQAPLFRSPQSGDYRIGGGSPAIDLCGDAAYTPMFQDIEFQDHGFDWPTVANVEGPLDAGADEDRNPAFFADGFES